ncbi:DUF6157 family protein [Dyadobacter sandarakinus]|uniref:Uncharacterized protein n=1 Tax=Dyadobacter sandarakinus TaxID=2747268 RepID=A0ABX7I7K4_9BACT|nr:DUF6157 family protein [Dyadobacter sandarakinus]QRR01780.1 hypothetical protein HWI92_13100 [Dyadobacter sandarakinus]
MHTTNYINTFIEVAEDSTAEKAEVPPMKGAEKTVAGLQFELVYDHPYQYTSDDLIFGVYARRNGLKKVDLDAEREKFFSRGQACMRASPLAKKYGWGVHSNEEGKVALYPVESEEYKRLAADEQLKHTRAMRSKKS